jgi:site-specific recombinase XerD
MDHAQQCHSRRTDPLCKGLLTSYLDTYPRYLMERGYARRTIDGYHACFAHFSQWVRHRRQAVRRVDKALVAETSICLAVTARNLSDVIGWSRERH